MIGNGLLESAARAVAGIRSRAYYIGRRRVRAWHILVILALSVLLLTSTAAMLRPSGLPDAATLESSANLRVSQAAPEILQSAGAQPPAPSQSERPAEAPRLSPAPAEVVDPLSRIEWAPSPNYGRRTAKVDTVVLHTTEDTLQGALKWFQSTASMASSHYMVGRDGRILQVVKEDQAAYHAGVVTSGPGTRWYGTNPNHYSIGIEMESLKSFKTPADMPDAQRRAVFALVRDIVTRYSIPIDRQHIVAHAEINPGDRTDPGPGFPWDDLMAYLKAGR
ncbi:MAG: hypothetical protein EPO21_03435 [Chloroflexota bacterium]|nr:MAG: hypothetical protein EPO21_03435 [Chloroflexota bacterium]